MDEGLLGSDLHKCSESPAPPTRPATLRLGGGRGLKWPSMGSLHERQTVHGKASVETETR